MGNAGRVLMIPKGDYNAATTYEMLDFVYYQGRSYVCKQTSTGNAPTNTTYWQALTGDASAEIQALTNQLTDEVTTRSALGAKNLLPLDLANCKTRNTSGTWSGNAYTISGVTFTVNEDNTINVNGTSAAEIEFKLGIYAKTDNITTGCIVSNGDAGVSGNWLSTLQYRSDSSFISQDNFISDKVITVPSNCTNIEFTIYINPNKTLSNVVFKPMIRLASDAGTTYQPYAKTNVELTADVKAEKITCETGANVTSLRSNVVKMGNLIIGNFQFEGACTSSDEILTVPAGYRPANGQDLSGIIIVNNNMGLGYYRLDASGKLRQTSTSSAASGGTGSFAYYIGQL